DGLDASLELHSRLAGGYEVRNRRSFGRSRLFIFEVSAVDVGKTGRPVVVWWFVSGRNAQEIIKYYTKKLQRGTRFITFGSWAWASRRGTYSLRLNKPADELEILTAPSDSQQNGDVANVEAGDEEDSDPALAAIHAGRRVPVYRKLGDFNSKRLREITHAVLELIDDSAIPETFPSEMIRQAKLIPRSQAMREIHFPPPNASMAEYEQSRSPAHVRMILEDFFWLTFAVGLKRGKRIQERKEATIKIDDTVKRAVSGVLPFKLTS